MLRRLILTCWLCFSSLLAMSQGDDCVDAIDISALFGNPLGEVTTSPMFDNTNATAGDDDPTVGTWCSFGDDQFDNTLWFSFAGDGGSYFLNTVDCGSTNYNTDTQFALYSGECGALTPVWCSEDGPDAEIGIYPAGGNFLTEVGVSYLLVVDGYDNGSGGAVGEFCLEATQIQNFPCEELSAGEYNFTETFVCPNSGITMEVTEDSVIPVSGAGERSGFVWFMSTAVLTGGAPSDQSSIVRSYGFQIGNYPTTVFNSLTNTLEPGDYYVTGFAWGNVALDEAGNQDWSTGCYTYGESIQVTFGSVLDITFEVNEGAQTATASASGGVGDYTYEWNNGDSGSTISYDSSETYVVTVTDESGCNGTHQQLVVCSNMSTGEYNVTPPYVCHGTVFKYEATTDSAIPPESPGLFSGFFWVRSTEELTSDPPTSQPTVLGYIGAFTEITTITIDTSAPTFNFDPGDYFLTGMVYHDLEEDAEGFLDFNTGCFAFGESIPFTIASEVEVALEVDEVAQTITASAAGGSGEYTFTWESGETGSILNYNDSGNYVVTVTDGTDCDSTDESVNVLITGIKDLAEIDMSLFPNPSQEFLNLNWNNPELELITYSVVNLAGQELKSGPVNNTARTLSISVEDLSTGHYILILSDYNNARYQTKFVVSR